MFNINCGFSVTGHAISILILSRMEHYPAIEEVDDLDLIPDDELEETYMERLAGLKGVC